MNSERNVSDTANVKNYLTLQFIWTALVISVAIYFWVAYFLLSSDQFSPFLAPVKVMFPALAAISLLIIIPQILFQSFLSDDKLFPKVLENIRAGKNDASVTKDPGSSVLLQNHMTFSIITWSLGEAPAIFGLMLTFVSGDIRYVAGFALYSILNMFVFRPSRARYEDQVGRLRRYLTARV